MEKPYRDKGTKHAVNGAKHHLTLGKKRYWGKNGEYGPFSIDARGWPNCGEVMRAYRKAKKMSARALANQYTDELRVVFGKEVDDQPVSERWITAMEKENRVPQDLPRREIIARVLGIPPILLGLGALTDLLPDTPKVLTTQTSSQTALKSMQVAHSSIRQYDQFLTLYWQLDFTSTAQQSLHDIEGTEKELRSLAPLVTGKELSQVYELLCGFYPLSSTVYADLRNYSKALAHANDAVVLADNIKNNKMRAVALYQRGFVNLQWGISQGEQLIDFTRVDAAVADFEQALPLAIPLVEAAIRLDLALALAYQKKKKGADNNLLKAEYIVDRGGLEDGTFVDLFANLDKGRFHLGRAEVLIALKQFDNANDALFEAKEGISPVFTRRHAWIDILQAKVYFGKRNITLAAQTALDTLKVVKDINSASNIALISDLHSQLVKGGFGNMESVRELGAALILP